MIFVIITFVLRYFCYTLKYMYTEPKTSNLFWPDENMLKQCFAANNFYSKTLFNAVFMRPEQVVRCLLCSKYIEDSGEHTKVTMCLAVAWLWLRAVTCSTIALFCLK